MSLQFKKKIIMEGVVRVKSAYNTWDVFWTNEVQMRQCSRRVASRRRVAGAIRSLINARSLQLECTRVLQDSLLLPVLTYGSEMILREKERSRAVQMDNFRGLLGIRRVDKVLNAWIRQLCKVMKGVDEKTDEGALR